MRYLKYWKIIILGLFSLTLTFIQCRKETGFNPNPFITGQVTFLSVPIPSVKVRLWIAELQSDTLTYLTDSLGNYSTERINNWFDKDIIIEFSKTEDAFGREFHRIGPNGYNADSVTPDAIYYSRRLKLFSSHYVGPKKFDFLNGPDRSYLYIINDPFGTILEWRIENNTKWISIQQRRYVGWYDYNHLKAGGYVIHEVRIDELLTPGTYDSSFLVITDRGSTVIPVHVVVE